MSAQQAKDEAKRAREEEKFEAAVQAQLLPAQAYATMARIVTACTVIACAGAGRHNYVGP